MRSEIGILTGKRGIPRMLTEIQFSASKKCPVPDMSSQSLCYPVGKGGMAQGLSPETDPVIGSRDDQWAPQGSTNSAEHLITYLPNL
jgi:hypothetical protein